MGKTESEWNAAVIDAERALLAQYLSFYKREMPSSRTYANEVNNPF